MTKNDKEINEAASKELADEAKKYGFGPVDENEKHLNLDDEEEDDDAEDMGDLDDEEDDEESDDDSDDSDNEDDNDDSEDDSEDEDDSDKDEDEDDDEDDDSNRKKKKVIPFKAHNKLRKELGETKRQLEEALENNKALEAKLPDDYQQRVDELVKEIGVKDPDSLKKILDFTKSVVDNSSKKNESRLAELEKMFAESRPIVDEFTDEWPAFAEKSFKKEFPNATPEQVKNAEKLMHKLAHDKKTGGKLYVDEKTGKTLLDPYELDYIFFKNKPSFSAIVTSKKVKSMESARTQGITVEKEGDKGSKKLNKDSSAKDIREMDRFYSQQESGMSSLRTGDTSEI